MLFIGPYTSIPPTSIARRSLPILLLEELLSTGRSLIGLVELNRLKINDVDGSRNDKFFLFILLIKNTFNTKIKIFII